MTAQERRLINLLLGTALIFYGLIVPHHQLMKHLDALGESARLPLQILLAALMFPLSWLNLLSFSIGTALIFLVPSWRYRATLPTCRWSTPLLFPSISCFWISLQVIPYLLLYSDASTMPQFFWALCIVGASLGLIVAAVFHSLKLFRVGHTKMACTIAVLIGFLNPIAATVSLNMVNDAVMLNRQNNMR